MPIYHLTTKPLSRRSGRAATAAAAYRAADKIHDLRTGMTWDFTRRSGVEHAEIVLPASAQGESHWARNRTALWNAAEKSESRSNSRTAREYEVALPHEFTRAQQRELVRRLSAEIANRYQVAVDFAIHLPHWHGDQRNVHAHLLTTTRVLTATGLGEKSSPEWSDTDRFKAGLESSKRELKDVRKFWADIQNEKFKELGMAVRVDHRTLQEQGIEREPSTHLGPAVSGMHRRGMDTQVAARIREQQRLAARLRIERLVQLRELARERAQVDRSIIDVSRDLAAARRDLIVHRPSLSLEDIQRNARQEWLALRAERLGQEQAPGAEPGLDQSAALKSADLPSLEERQKQAAQKWLALRNQGRFEPGRERDPEHEPETDKSQEKSRDYGIDDDFGL